MVCSCSPSARHPVIAARASTTQAPFCTHWCRRADPVDSKARRQLQGRTVRQDSNRLVPGGAENPRVGSVRRSPTSLRWRPYRVECTGSLPTSEVKRRRARLVLGWGTAREDLRVLPALVRPGAGIRAARRWSTAVRAYKCVPTTARRTNPACTPLGFALASASAAVSAYSSVSAASS